MNVPNPLIPASAHAGLVLASRSPRRSSILSGLGITFDVDPAHEDVEVDANGSFAGDVFALPEALARRKCDEVARRHPGALVLAADTVVILGGEILNKPADDAEAVRFLGRLSGRTHAVVTGVALRRLADGVDMVESERTNVTFRTLTGAEISGYVSTGEGRDKAGSYAAQGLGAALVRSIDGCFYNVVGLPVARFLDMLKRVPE
jgi:septum formation protein